MGILAIFNRHRLHYGGLGVIAGVTRLVLLITALVMVGMTAPGVAAAALQGTKATYDTLELFGLILGSVTILYALLSLVPGTRVSPVKRLFELGALLVVAYIAFLVGVALTPGYLSSSYVAPGQSKAARTYSTFVAGAISGVLILLNTVIDFARRYGPPGSTGSYEEEQHA